MKLDYASAIINLRIKLNLSQAALAELLGVSCFWFILYLLSVVSPSHSQKTQNQMVSQRKTVYL